LTVENVITTRHRPPVYLPTANLTAISFESHSVMAVCFREILSSSPIKVESLTLELLTWLIVSPKRKKVHTPSIKSAYIPLTNIYNVPMPYQMLNGFRLYITWTETRGCPWLCSDEWTGWIFEENPENGP
jgi:hypothetical protein